MLDSIKTLDENIFLYLNSLHHPLLDHLMWLFSEKLFWTPLYIWFLWLLYKQFPKKFWTVLIAIILLIVVSDQLCNLSKNSIMRLRPTNEVHLQGLIHTVNGYTGGLYGYYSGHAANSFAVAFFFLFSVLEKKKYLVVVALLYAILTSYSRIYLGVHYPFDVLTGVLVGSLTGIGFACAHKKIRTNFLQV